MTATLLSTHLPYCLLRQPDGRYAVLNRRYKPVGMTTPKAEWIEYADHPCLVRIKGLTPTAARGLSWDASPDVERIYLYNDGTNPMGGADLWEAYAARLKKLAGLLQE